MRKPPALATLLLSRLGPADESLVGDLLEECEAARSRTWFWRQTLAAIACGAIRDVRHMRREALAAIATGWFIVAAVFLLGDRIADAVAGLFWDWSRQTAYVDHVWWPFYIGALLVTYGGFALSAVVVALLNRNRPAMLLAHVVSIFILLAVTGLLFKILIVRQVAVPLPHPLFYAVSVTLPFYWHSGVVLVPLTTLLFGITAVRPRHLQFSDSRSNDS